MLHILGIILSIIGILLAVILGIVLLILLVVLFAPVHYWGRGSKQEGQITAEGGVFWLLHLFSVRCHYETGQEVKLQIRIFGISYDTIRTWLEKREKKKQESKKTESPVQEHQIETAESEPEQEKLPEKELSEYTKESEPAKPEKPETQQTGKKSFLSRIFQKISGAIQKIRQVIRFIFQIPGRIWRRIKKIHFTIQGICDKIKAIMKFLESPEFREAKSVIWNNVVKILRHIRPRRIEGTVTFGFEDPAVTGQTLAGIAVLYPVLPGKLHVTPMFDRKILEGDIRLKGHLTGFVLVKLVLQTYFNKSVQRVIKRWKRTR